MFDNIPTEFERIFNKSAEAKKWWKQNKRKESSMRKGIKVKVYKHGVIIGRYASLADAAKELGLNPTEISTALRSAVPVVKGYKFIKINKYERKQVKG